MGTFPSINTSECSLESLLFIVALANRDDKLYQFDNDAQYIFDEEIKGVNELKPQLIGHKHLRYRTLYVH